jgi:hypothetical protein
MLKTNFHFRKMKKIGCSSGAMDFTMLVSTNRMPRWGIWQHHILRLSKFAGNAY